MYTTQPSLQGQKELIPLPTTIYGRADFVPHFTKSSATHKSRHPQEPTPTRADTHKSRHPQEPTPTRADTHKSRQSSRLALPCLALPCLALPCLALLIHRQQNDKKEVSEKKNLLKKHKKRDRADNVGSVASTGITVASA